VLVDGKELRTGTANLPRPDVGQVFPECPGAATSGYELRIARTELPADPKHTVEVMARFQPRHGGQPIATSVGRVVVHRAETSVVSHDRGDYKQVWQREARTLTNAMFAVSGSDDPKEYSESGTATALDVKTTTNIGPNDTVLEVGCGTGRVGVKLAPSCGRWIGADISANMISHALESMQGMPNVDFHELSGASLDCIADASLDVVYCTTVFMHLDEWDRFGYVRDAFRVLRPGGRIYFDNINLLGEDGWSIFEKLAVQHDPATRPANVSKCSTPEELRVYAERAGFENITVRPGPLFVTVIARKPAR
jgi:SAM-dependent methyltransferase